MVTYGRSGIGESVEDIKSFCNGDVIESPLEVYCDDILYFRDKVTRWLKEIFSL